MFTKVDHSQPPHSKAHGTSILQRSKLNMTKRLIGNALRDTHQTLGHGIASTWLIAHGKKLEESYGIGKNQHETAGNT